MKNDDQSMQIEEILTQLKILSQQLMEIKQQLNSVDSSVKSSGPTASERLAYISNTKPGLTAMLPTVGTLTTKVIK